MPKTRQLSMDAPWSQVQVSTKDWDAADPALLTTMLTHMHIIRAFEETALEFAGEKLVNGPLHSSIGQEGGAAGSVLALAPSDQVNGSHRGHHQFLSKALGFISPDGLDPGPISPMTCRRWCSAPWRRFAAWRRATALARRSMPARWKEAGALGTNAIVGGAVPFATGFAWANKHSGSQAVSVSYFGDGAMNIGSVLESLNLAAAWKLPVCFFVENNQYGVSTTVEKPPVSHGYPDEAPVSRSQVGRSTAWIRSRCI